MFHRLIRNLKTGNKIWGYQNHYKWRLRQSISGLKACSQPSLCLFIYIYLSLSLSFCIFFDHHLLRHYDVNELQKSSTIYWLNEQSSGFCCNALSLFSNQRFHLIILSFTASLMNSFFVVVCVFVEWISLFFSRDYNETRDVLSRLKSPLLSRLS